MWLFRKANILEDAHVFLLSWLHFPSSVSLHSMLHREKKDLGKNDENEWMMNYPAVAAGKEGYTVKKGSRVSRLETGNSWTFFYGVEPKRWLQKILPSSNITVYCLYGLLVLADISRTISYWLIYCAGWSADCCVHHSNEPGSLGEGQQRSVQRLSRDAIGEPFKFNLKLCTAILK